MQHGGPKRIWPASLFFVVGAAVSETSRSTLDNRSAWIKFIAASAPFIIVGTYMILILKILLSLSFGFVILALL